MNEFIYLLNDNKELFFTYNYILLIKIIIFIIFSLICIIEDFKKKEVNSIMLIIISIIILIFNFFYNKNIFINSVIGLSGIIVVFLLIYFISKGGIGLGDMFYIIFFNSLFGYFFTLVGFILSFWIATLILIIPYLLKMINKKTQIPLIPFLFTGNLVSLLVTLIK